MLLGVKGHAVLLQPALQRRTCSRFSQNQFQILRFLVRSVEKLRHSAGSRISICADCFQSVFKYDAVRKVCTMVITSTAGSSSGTELNIESHPPSSELQWQPHQQVLSRLRQPVAVDSFLVPQPVRPSTSLPLVHH